MKFLMFFLILTLSFTAQAVTSGQFLGRYGIIRVLPKDITGVGDSDGQILYEAMNVPPKDSFLGPGKAIEASDRGLQFICANRSKSGYECSIFVHHKGNGSLNFANKTMHYKVTGAEGDVYAKLFHTDANGEYHFVSMDGMLSVDVRPQYFEIYFKQAVRSQNEESGLVVVNVEDTLKISHIQDFWDSLNYNMDYKKRFMGMNAALNILAKNNPGYSFVYLTRGTELMAGKIEREFILNNNFPRGDFKAFNRENQDPIARMNSLRKLITASSAQKVILMSHNGGKDPEIFNKLAAEFKTPQVLPYVHVVYSTSSIVEIGTSLFPEQTGYVTSVELLMDWQQKGLVELTEALKFATVMVKRVVAEDPELKKLEEYSIPPFVNCDDFQWRWATDGEFQVLAPLREHLIKRCHMQAPLAGSRISNEN